MQTELMTYYEAIERASADMLAAARTGNWDQVVKLEGAWRALAETDPAAEALVQVSAAW